MFEIGALYVTSLPGVSRGKVQLRSQDGYCYNDSTQGSDWERKLLMYCVTNSTSDSCLQWSRIFPAEQVKEQQSTLFVKKLLAVAVSHHSILAVLLLSVPYLTYRYRILPT